jgi:hypothetical protein
MNWLRTGIIIACLILPLWAASLNGKWRLPFTDADGKEQESVLTFSVAGTTVTGTLIQNGKTRAMEFDVWREGEDQRYDPVAYRMPN